MAKKKRVRGADQGRLVAKAWGRAWGRDAKGCLFADFGHVLNTCFSEPEMRLVVAWLVARSNNVRPELRTAELAWAEMPGSLKLRVVKALLERCLLNERVIGAAFWRRLLVEVAYPVLAVFERKRPDDKRPRQTVDLALAHVRNRTIRLPYGTQARVSGSLLKKAEGAAMEATIAVGRLGPWGAAARIAALCGTHQPREAVRTLLVQNVDVAVAGAPRVVDAAIGDNVLRIMPWSVVRDALAIEYLRLVHTAEQVQ